jgi:hypothetical protein
VSYNNIGDVLVAQGNLAEARREGIVSRRRSVL